MTDKEQDLLLTKFANDNALARDIDVSITNFNKSFTAKKILQNKGANYEEVIMLSGIINGAENFLYWLRRNNYVIIAPKKLPKNFGKVKMTKKLKDFEKKFMGLRKVRKDGIDGT